MTAQMIERSRMDMQGYAGDQPITVESAPGALYVFGSELATLRILKKYRESKSVRHDWSENLQTWYISLEFTF